MGGGVYVVCCGIHPLEDGAYNDVRKDGGNELGNEIRAEVGVIYVPLVLSESRRPAVAPSTSMIAVLDGTTSWERRRYPI